MNKSADSASAAHPLAQRVPRQPAYSARRGGAEVEGGELHLEARQRRHRPRDRRPAGPDRRQRPPSEERNRRLGSGRQPDLGLLRERVPAVGRA